MSHSKAAALLLLLAPIASGCVPGAADPATPAASAPTTSNATTSPASSRPDPAKSQAAGIDACDVYREAIDHMEAMHKGGAAMYGETMDFANPKDTWFLGQFVWVDEYWSTRITDSLTPDVPQNVRAVLEKVAVTSHIANKMEVQARPDSEYKPAAKRAGLAADSADHVCENYKGQ